MTAGERASAPALKALDDLCRAYWLPLYAYVRRMGNPPADAEDLTQQFFSRLLSGDALRTADPARGRFRTFLLTSMQRFLVSEWRRGQAQKRGEGLVFNFDCQQAEEWLGLPGTGDTPEVEYDRRWADSVLNRALDRLAAEYIADGKGRLHAVLREEIWGRHGQRPAAELAGELGLTEGAMRVATHRMRRRFRELLRSEVAATVGTANDVDEELRHLAGLLAA